MRRMGTVVMFLAVAGCNGADSDGRWVPASDALAAHGVADWRASATANSQQVVLRDADRQSIGELQLVQAEPSSTISLEFRGDVWKQIVFAAEGKMTLSLDGREATLTWENGTWIGDAAAQSLLAESQPYADFVKLVGSEAQLGLATSATSAPVTSSPDASAPADLGGLHAPPPTLCCGEVVTTGSGWAWYWEEHAEATACKRAIDTLQATCDVSSGYDCCSLPKSGCTACVNWGTGFACSTAGYLQYVPLKGTTCR